MSHLASTPGVFAIVLLINFFLFCATEASENPELERALHSDNNKLLCRSLYSRMSFVLWKQICSQSNSVVVGPFALRGSNNYLQDVAAESFNPKFQALYSSSPEAELYGLMRRISPYVYEASIKQDTNQFEGMNLRRKVESINRGDDDNDDKMDLIKSLLGERETVPTDDTNPRDVEHDLNNPLYLI